VDLAIVATGHVWPDEDEATRAYFPSPWSGLMDAEVRPCHVGIMGTSLSGLDAAMAVVMQHGHLSTTSSGWRKKSGAENDINVAHRDPAGGRFYCPIPYEPLAILTQAVAEAEIKRADGLLDRIFTLMVKELRMPTTVVRRNKSSQA
jgi:uncharacterized NAD(P)/FAD-binding protein YdhS